MEIFEQLCMTLEEAMINEREICVGSTDCNNCKMMTVFVPGECSFKEGNLYICAGGDNESYVHIPVIEEILYDECEDIYEIKSGVTIFHINCC